MTAIYRDCVGEYELSLCSFCNGTGEDDQGDDFGRCLYCDNGMTRVYLPDPDEKYAE